MNRTDLQELAILRDNVEAGRLLIQELDRELAIPAALWLYLPEIDRWRLMLAVEEVDSLGPRTVYAQINRAISRMSESDAPPLDDITVVSPRDKLIEVIGTVLKTGRGLGQMSITGSSFNNTYVEDALIYRMDLP